MRRTSAPPPGHHEVVRAVRLADVIERGDVGMAEGRHRPRLARQPCPRLGVVGHLMGQDLDRHVAAEPHVLRPVDLAHPPGANKVHHLVRAETRPAQDRDPPRRGCGEGFSQQPPGLLLVAEERPHLAEQTLVATAGPLQEPLPLALVAGERRVIQLLDLAEVPRAAHASAPDLARRCSALCTWG
jgi:hypothetical protein